MNASNFWAHMDTTAQLGYAKTASPPKWRGIIAAQIMFITLSMSHIPQAQTLPRIPWTCGCETQRGSGIPIPLPTRRKMSSVSMPSYLISSCRRMPTYHGESCSQSSDRMRQLGKDGITSGPNSPSMIVPLYTQDLGLIAVGEQDCQRSFRGGSPQYKSRFTQFEQGTSDWSLQLVSPCVL